MLLLSQTTPKNTSYQTSKGTRRGPQGGDNQANDPPPRLGAPVPPKRERRFSTSTDTASTRIVSRSGLLSISRRDASGMTKECVLQARILALDAVSPADAVQSVALGTFMTSSWASPDGSTKPNQGLKLTLQFVIYICSMCDNTGRTSTHSTFREPSAFPFHHHDHRMTSLSPCRATYACGSASSRERPSESTA